jgi:hypothetical protein
VKTAGPVFVMIGCAALMCGTSFAAPSGPAKQQASSASSGDTATAHPRAEHAPPADGEKHQAGEPSHGPGNLHASGKSLPPSPASVTKAKRPNQAPSHQENSASGSAMNLREPGLGESGGAVKGGAIQNEPAGKALPVRPSNAVRPAVPAPNNARHRTSNPAVVGGSVSPTAKNTGAINGALIKRKP